MAKIACLMDFWEYAQMIGCLLKEAGYEVLLETPPIDFERLMRFGPQLVITGLFRKRVAFNRPLRDFDEDILGLETLRSLESYPAIGVVPILLVGSGICEYEVPTTVHYDLFLEFPDDMKLFLPKVEELVTKVKTRRKISGYICPHCGSRMTFLREPAENLFCPRCNTSVAIVENRECLATTSEGQHIPCSLDKITPPHELGGE